jgi:multiple sugar transport system ATP-binding protein
MDNGVLQQIGTSQSLYTYPASMFVAGFIGSPPMNMFEVWVASDARELFFEGPGFRLLVPGHYAGRLADWEGRRVVMGLRPEDIHDARFLPDAGPETVVHATVEIREYLGSEIDLHLSTAGQAFVARLDDRSDARPGQALDVVFDTDKMHVFNPATQRALL